MSKDKPPGWIPIDVQSAMDDSPEKQAKKFQQELEFVPLTVPAEFDADSVSDAETEGDSVVEEAPKVEVPSSNLGYIFFDGWTDSEVHSEGGVDFFVTDSVQAFSGCSQESIDLHSAAEGKGDEYKYQFGQDAAAVVQLPNGEVLLVVADGVGQSYLGNMAARGACISLVKESSRDLQANVEQAVETLTSIHDSLPDPNTGAELIDSALLKTKEESGSQTKCIQVVVSESGEVNGLFCGDGGATILRANGEVEHFTSEFPSSSLSTLSGKTGETSSFTAQLEPGDSVLLYSDGLQVSLDDAEAMTIICEIINSGENVSERIKDVLIRMGKEADHDDDRTILFYQRPKEE